MCVAGAIVFHAGLKAGAIGNARQAGLQAGGTADTRAAALEAGTSGNDLPFSFLSVGREAGLNAVTIFGGRETNRYLLETTGCGVAMFDYDGDGLQDLFFVNGTTLEGFPKGQEPRPHLYRNKGNARFEDVTVAAGLNEQFGWGQGACAGDYDNDGFPDISRHLLRPESPVPQHRPRPLRRCHRPRWRVAARARAGARAARSSTTIATAGWTCSSPTTSTSISPPRRRRTTGCAATRASRSPADRPGSRADATPSITTSAAAASPTYRTPPASCARAGTFGLGVSTLDFDNDGWTDLYVANDSNPSALYRNRHDGTFEDIGSEGGLRLQPGRQAAGGHGCRHRRLRSQRHDATS